MLRHIVNMITASHHLAKHSALNSQITTAVHTKIKHLITQLLEINNNARVRITVLHNVQQVMVANHNVLLPKVFTDPAVAHLMVATVGNLATAEMVPMAAMDVPHMVAVVLDTDVLHTVAMVIVVDLVDMVVASDVHLMVAWVEVTDVPHTVVTVIVVDMVATVVASGVHHTVAMVGTDVPHTAAMVGTDVPLMVAMVGTDVVHQLCA